MAQPSEENLRIEYGERFQYQAHLTDRRWKANGLCFLIFGFSVNAIRPGFSPNFGIYIAILNLAAIVCTLCYDITVRNRLLQNMERATEVAGKLSIKAFMHWHKAAPSVSGRW